MAVFAERMPCGRAAAPDPSAAAQRSAPLAGLRVLVVEDDPRVREAVGRLLRLAQGHPDLPVILMTGQKDALSALDDLAVRPTVLRKPVDLVALRAAVLARTRT